MNEHLIAWLIYCVAFMLVYAYWSRIVRFMPVRFIRQILKGLLAVLLLTPVMSSALSGWWSPAWLHFSYSALLGDEAEMGRALFNLFLGVCVLILALAADSGWYHWRRRR